MKPKSKIFMAILAMCIVLTMFVGCNAAEQPNTEISKSAETSDVEETPSSAETTEVSKEVEHKVLKIGVSDALTGTSAPYGLPAANAIRLAADQLNAEGGLQIGNEIYDIELVVYDNKSDAGESVSVLQKLIDVDQVKFILGWSASTPTIPAVQAIQDMDITMVIGNARSPSIMLYSTGNAFRSATANYYNPIADCQFIKDQGANKVAVLAFMNDTGYSLHVNNVINAFGEVGVEVVTVETFNAGDTDLLSQMTKISASGADALYLAGNIYESAVALRQLRELGSNMTMYTFSSGTGSQWLEICTNEQMAGSYTVRPQVADPGSENDARAVKFIKAYEEKFGENPSQTATNGYDNLWILAAALKRAGTTEWTVVNAAFKELTVEELDPRVIMDYEPVNGKLFDDRGQAFHPYSVCKWGTEEKNWVFEKTIGKNLGHEFLNEYLDKMAIELGLE
jgi:branched-chain amino acid transport system substrate-binding protein